MLEQDASVLDGTDTQRGYAVPVASYSSKRTMTPGVSLKKRGGFTLIETIVTVGLLAVLAAFVIPTVVQKAGVGDPVKVASDVAAIGTALEGFQSDIKAGFPNQLRMLTDVPTTQNHLVDSTTA